MKIIIYGLNFSPELIGIGKYTGEMAAWLADQGHSIRVITALPYYPAWQVDSKYRSWNYTREVKEKLIVYRCPLWVPKYPIFFSRLIHHLSFAFTSLPILFYRLLFSRPDVLICIAPSFIAAPQAALLCKIMNIKSWLHFQDFEICAMFSSIQSDNTERINNLFHRIQSFFTRRFTLVSSISQKMCASAERRNVSNKQIIYFPNWVDTTYLQPGGNGSYFRRKWNIGREIKVILYSGNIGEKQGLENLIFSARHLKQRKDIVFIIVGDGARKAALMRICYQQKIDNVQFHPLQSYELLPSLLCMADLHIVLQKGGFADALLPSKIASIFSVGGYSVITAKANTELANIVGQHPGIATLVEPDNPLALTATLESFCDSRDIVRRRLYPNKEARDYAVSQLSKKAILRQFEHTLMRLAKGGIK
ncbi:MAG: colanic acid biosynthesis glycosyltransferase WcaI [Candidatus Electrothrix sp. AW2]|nr:colanic acid biosynthesis glycosyltransferase WcaI [Candidatus Electrothrix gigas]